MSLLKPRVRRQILQSILIAALTGNMRHLSSLAHAWLLHLELFHTLEDHRAFRDRYQASGQFKTDLFRAREELVITATPGEVVLYQLQEQNVGMLAEILRGLGDQPRVRAVHRADCPKYCLSCGGTPLQVAA